MTDFFRLPFSFSFLMTVVLSVSRGSRSLMTVCGRGLDVRGLSYSHAGAIWTGLNANADLISKGSVAMVPTGAAAIALLSIAQESNVRVRQLVPTAPARFAPSNR
jgi:hypothetical protein